MNKNFLFAFVSFFVVTNLYQGSAWAGTESWYSGENWNGGVVVRDRYGNGSDRDAFLIFDALRSLQRKTLNSGSLRKETEKNLKRSFARDSGALAD